MSDPSLPCRLPRTIRTFSTARDQFYIVIRFLKRKRYRKLKFSKETEFMELEVAKTFIEVDNSGSAARRGTSLTVGRIFIRHCAPKTNFIAQLQFEARGGYSLRLAS